MGKKDFLFIIGLLATVFLFYRHTLSYDLIWDDQDLPKTISRMTRQPAAAVFQGGFLYAPLGISGQDFYYRPLTMLTFLLENRIWGNGSRHLRLTNVLIFSCALLFLFLFFRRCGQGRYFAHAAVSLFAFFPLNSDNIVWIVGRGDLLLLFCGGLLLLFFDRFMEERSVSRYLPAFLTFFAGIFCKETFIVFLPLLILYEFWKTRKISFSVHLPFLSVTLFFFFIKNIILKIGNVPFAVPELSFSPLLKLLNVIGYYSRSLAFPFMFDRLANENDLPNVPYAVMGIAALGLLALGFGRVKKMKQIFFPLTLILLPLLLHSALAFTLLEPFRLASRYMMLPALGMAWLGALWLAPVASGQAPGRLDFKKCGLGIFVLLFALSTLNAVNAYRNEVRFWTACRRNFPHNVAMNYQLANAHITRGDYLAGEVALHAAITRKMSRRESVMTALLYMRLEYFKADFKQVSLWESRIRRHELYPSEQYEFASILGDVLWDKGEFAAAEKILLGLTVRFPQARNSYLQLHGLYLAQNLWEKAGRSELILKEKFSFQVEASAAREKKRFAALSPSRKIDFFITHRNFAAAIALIGTPSGNDLITGIRLAYLYYRMGLEYEADSLIRERLRKSPADYKVLNTVGLFYVKSILRASKALALFRASVLLNKNQRAVSDMIRHLETTYFFPPVF